MGTLLSDLLALQESRRREGNGSTAQIMGRGRGVRVNQTQEINVRVSLKKDEEAEKRLKSLPETSFIPQTLQASPWRLELPVWVLPGPAATAERKKMGGEGRNREKKNEHVCNWHKKKKKTQHNYR